MNSLSPLFLPPVPSAPEGLGLETTGGAKSLIRALRAESPTLAARSVLELTRELGQAGLRFLDPEDPVRRSADERVAAEAGLSASAARAIVGGMARDWTPDRLERLVRTDFPDPAVLDEFRPDGTGGRWRAVGGRLAFHLGSGSVPGVSATSMIRSLLVKCPILLKPGRADTVLATLFARTLQECHPDLARAVAVVYWPRGRGGPLAELGLRESDQVVAYGGSELIRLLRSQLPPTTPLVAYHHRLSIAAVARECLGTASRAQAVARAAAGAVAVFDQRGCVSPRIIWVEDGAAISPVEWAELLSQELEILARALPPSTESLSIAAARQQQRTTWEMKQAAQTGHRVFGGTGNAGTVLYDPDPLRIPGLPTTGRTVVVKPVATLDRLSDALEPVRDLLQTLALAASPSRTRGLAEGLCHSGITRVTSFEEQPWPPAWWRHDGTGPLLALVRWVTAP